MHEVYVDLQCSQSNRRWAVSMDDILIAAVHEDEPEATHVVFRGFPERGKSTRPLYRAKLAMDVEDFYSFLVARFEDERAIGGVANPFMYVECTKTDDGWVIRPDDLTIIQPSKDGDNQTFITFKGVPGREGRRQETYANVGMSFDEFLAYRRRSILKFVNRPETTASVSATVATEPSS